MATTATAPRTNGRRADERSRPVPSAAATRRHRQAPLVALGVLLVLGCALAFADASVHLGSREQVLVVAQPVSAGQVLTSGDLRTARVSTGSGLDVVPVDQEATVLGRRVAVPLVAGSLLTATEVGSAPAVGSGSDVVAVGLKAGAYPPEVAPGGRVQVVPVASGSSGTNSSERGERQPDQCHRLGGHRRPSRLGRADGVLASGFGEQLRRSRGVGGGRSGEPGRGRWLRWPRWRSARSARAG